MSSPQHSLTVPVRLTDRVSVDRQAQLEAALDDLRIYGTVVMSGGCADHASFSLQLAPDGKVRRAILLAEDIAEGADALTVTVRSVNDSRLLSIGLQYRSYYPL